MEDAEKKQEGAGVKTLSKWAMVAASLWIAALSLLKWVGLINAKETDIIYSAIAIVGIWSPTYLSIWLDKIRDIRFGGAE